MLFNNSKLAFHVKLRLFFSTNTIHAYMTALKFSICKHKKGIFALYGIIGEQKNTIKTGISIDMTA